VPQARGASPPGPGTLPPGRALVTGAAGGLGRALVAEFRHRGWHVLATDLQATAGVDAALDVTNPHATQRLAQEFRPTVWVNNAGVLAAGDAATQPMAEVERAVQVNFLGVVYGTRAAVEVMRPAGGGVVLTVASLAAFTPAPGEAVYAATKHAVRAFILATAAEQRGTGMRFHLLCPDGMATPMLEDRVDDPTAAASFSGRRLLDPTRVATLGVDLVERRRTHTVRSVPRSRGALIRTFGGSSRVFLTVSPLFLRRGRAAQQRLRARSGG